MNNLEWFSKCDKWGKSYISICIAIYTYSHTLIEKVYKFK